MIRRIVVFCICLILINICCFYRELESYNEKINDFESYIKEYCINGEYGEEVYLVFNYEKIEKYLENNMVNYTLERDSLTGFNIYVDIKKGIFLKEVKESFYLRRGDLYDSRN